MDESLFAELLAPIECALLEFAGDGRWRLASRVPRWLAENAELAIERGEPLLSRAAAPPFLANFLARAEAHWASGERSTLHSNPWLELGRDGGEWSLRAAAVALESGRRAVFVERADSRVALDSLLDRTRDGSKRRSPLHEIVHDLKGPLAGIMGSLSLLAGDRSLSIDQREVADIGLESVRKQDVLIRRILEKPADELSAGDGRKPTDLVEAVRTIVDVYSEVARSRGVELASVACRERTAPLVVVGHRGRIERVLANVVEHALRRSSNGERIAIEFEEQSGLVIVQVDDGGPAIPEDVRASWFDGLSRSLGARGAADFALVYCKQALAASGGEIDSVALVPRGSRIRIRLRKPA